MVNAKRAQAKGKKRQQRRLTAKLHKLEHFVMRNGDRETANAVMRRVEKRERLNRLANHTRKADRNAGQAQPNTADNSQGAA